MSNAGSQAAAFYRDVARNLTIWTVGRDGREARLPRPTRGYIQPFWSSHERVNRIIRTVPAYSGSHSIEISYPSFKGEVLPRLRRDTALLGINWSGATAKGYDLEPDWVQHCIEVELERLGGPPATPLEQVIEGGLVVGYRLTPRTPDT